MLRKGSFGCLFSLGPAPEGNTESAPRIKAGNHNVVPDHGLMSATAVKPGFKPIIGTVVYPPLQTLFEARHA